MSARISTRLSTDLFGGDVVGGADDEADLVFLDERGRSSWKKRARPMSRIFTIALRSSSMLPGLMSRWTRPASWACCRAERRLADVVAAAAGFEGAVAANEVVRLQPSTNSRTRKMELVVLVDVVGADDIGMIEAGDGGASRAKTFARDGVVGLLRRAEL